MKRRIVFVQSKPIAIVFVIEINEYAQRVDAVEQERRDPIDERLKTDETALPNGLPRQQKMKALLEGAVLVTRNEAGIICVDTHPNLKKRRSVFVARAIADVMPREPRHVYVINFAMREMNLPKSIGVARGIHTEAWLTTVNNEWACDKTVITVPYTSLKRKKPNRSIRIF